jgi:hypothetical protein
VTKEEFAAKVDWEGSVMDAVAYGMKTKDLPSDAPYEIKQAWQRLEMAQLDVDFVGKWLWDD